MAEPAAPPAPLGAPAPATPAAPRPPPAPTKVIKASEIPPPAEPATPPKKGSAKADIFEALAKKATGAAEAPAAAPAKTGEPARQDATPPGEPAPTGKQPVGEPGAPAAPPGKKEKINPWNLLKTEREAHAKTQKEYQDYRAKVPQAAEVEGLMKRAEDAEKVAGALSDEIRYHAYEKSPEFKKQFQDPYEAAFRRAMTDLKEVPITDPATGQARQMTTEELSDTLAQISFMSLAQAKETATRLFPDFAQDMLEARKEIRGLWDKRQAALAEWKDKGAQREQLNLAQRQKQHGELATSVKAAWDKANAEALADESRGEYFKPRDGDAEWNRRLEQGYKFTNAAFATNLLDGNLTAEQREKAVRWYAAVRHRSAGWGPLRHDNERLHARVTELEAELKGYKETTPPAGGSEPGGIAPAVSGKAIDRITADLGKLAK